MKKQRSLPFGYMMRGGNIQKEKNEAKLVCRIYQMYEDGSSLQNIADTINGQSIPYSEASGTWNKHQIKRILENTRYSGGNGYPAILDMETMQRVQTFYREKNRVWQEPAANPEKIIWQRLICTECGGRMLRMGGKRKNLIIQCESCKKRISTQPNVFKSTLLKKLRAALEHTDEPYAPTPEIMRLENEISRRIEHPSDADSIRKLIFDAATKRYAACPSPPKESAEINWHTYKDMVETAIISADEIQLRLKNIWKDGNYGGDSKECTGDSRQPDADAHRTTEKLERTGSGLLPGQHG